MFIAARTDACASEIDQFEDVMKRRKRRFVIFINEENPAWIHRFMKWSIWQVILLWAVWAMQQYMPKTSRRQCIEMPTSRKILSLSSADTENLFCMIMDYALPMVDKRLRVSSAAEPAIR